MTHLTLVFLLACLSPLPVHGGWGTSKGQGGRWGHQWHSHGNGYGSRYGGKGSFASPHTHRADAMAFVVEALQQSSRGRRRSRSTSRTRSRSSSKRGRRSSSSSTAMQQELLELRKYRQEAEAAAAAAREEAKKQEEREAREAEFKKLEERLLKAIPTPVKSGNPASGHWLVKQRRVILLSPLLWPGSLRRSLIRMFPARGCALGSLWSNVCYPWRQMCCDSCWRTIL